MSIFRPACFFLPKETPMEKWAVIACDQFTSQMEYWQEAEALVGDAPSALRLILPEAFLGEGEERIGRIHQAMKDYEAGDVFRALPEGYVYVERTLKNGSVRHGLVGVIDLEAYDYRAAADSPIRATEQTVVERIPPRQKVRRGAELELSHVLLLCDDAESALLAPFEQEKAGLPLLYEAELMQGGGHIAGWQVTGEAAAAFGRRLDAYCEEKTRRFEERGQAPLLFAVGDGNHSLASAKAHWEQVKQTLAADGLEKHPARYAMVELTNLHDTSLVFEPIHRLMKNVRADELLAALSPVLTDRPEGEGVPLTCVTAGKTDVRWLKLTGGELPVAALQRALDQYLSGHSEAGIDYIHGEEALAALAAGEDTVGFLLSPMDKKDLFPGIVSGGVLPRKTFSMGHAEEKRYYIEARRIVPDNAAAR